MIREHINPSRLYLLMGAIMLSIFMAALDQTIVATALPDILKSLGGFNLLTWVYASYILTSTIVILIAGRLSDIYGRKILYLIGIAIFVLGSILSGLSGSILQLIIFRAIQGIGAGAMTSIAFASVGDLFTPRERGKWQGLFSSMFAIASVVGPLIGGYLTEHVSWHWIFYINVPIGIVAFLLIANEYPHIVIHKDESVDYLGITLFTILTTALVSAFIFGGTTFAWNSFQEIGLFALFVIFLTVFIISQIKRVHPLLPTYLFSDKNFVIVIVLAFISSFAMYGAIVFLPIYFQYIRGLSPTISGLYLTPMTIGIVIASITSGIIMSKTGKYKFMLYIGIVVASVGIYMLSHITVSSGMLGTVVSMLITGLGLGIFFPVLNIVAQNAFPVAQIGVVTGTLQLFRTIASAIGLSIMGSFMNNFFISALVKNKPSGLPAFLSSAYNGLKNSFSSATGNFSNVNLSGVPAAFHNFVVEITNAVYTSLTSAISHIMLFSSIIIIVSIIFIFFLKEVPLRTTND